MEVMGCLPLSVATLDPRSYVWVRGRERSVGTGRFKEAREVFEQVALDKDLIVFLTLPAYRLLD